MSKKVVLVPNGDAVYAVPVEVCEQYALEGDALAAAKSALSGESDVEGQSYWTDGDGFRHEFISNRHMVGGYSQ